MKLELHTPLGHKFHSLLVDVSLQAVLYRYNGHTVSCLVHQAIPARTSRGRVNHAYLPSSACFSSILLHCPLNPLQHLKYFAPSLNGNGIMKLKKLKPYPVKFCLQYTNSHKKNTYIYHRMLNTRL